MIKKTLQRAIDAVWHARHPQPFKRGALQNQMANAHKREYQSALVNNLTAAWNTSPTTVDQVTRADLKTLRARSREQYANNDYAKRFVGMAKSNVVGENGVKLQAKSRDNSGELDKEANAAIEREWLKWSRPANCDLFGQSGLVEIEQLLMYSELVDGEFCIIVHRINKYPYVQLEVIDAELLDLDYSEELRNGGRIKFGIEYNAAGKPVAYYLREFNETGDFYTLTSTSRRRIDARSFIHGYIKESPGQRRGFPQMATSLLRMNMLAGFENASLVNARTGASKMGFFTSPDGQGYQGDEVAPDGSLISDAEPGSFEQLPEGVQFQSFDPTYPNGEFADFSKKILRGIASGLGVNYNSLANDLEGVNFSSLRQGAIDEREAWKILQKWLINTALEKIYAIWLEQFLSFGAIKVGNGTLPLNKIDKFEEVVWQGRRWPWVDPLKDEQAATEAVNNRRKSISEIIRESGRDPDTVFAEMAADKLRLEELGLNMPESSNNSGSETEMEQDDRSIRNIYRQALEDGLIEPQPEYDELIRRLEAGNA
jgi:lambda family phage portal protein